MRSGAEAVYHAVKIYDRGLVCPAVFWAEVARHLEHRTALALLESLPTAARGMLRRVYAERPWSMRSALEDEDVRSVVEQWCKREGT